MNEHVTKMYREDIKNAKGDVVKLDLALRSRYLFTHRGTNVSTVNNRAFDSFAAMASSFIMKRAEA